jgi:uncharacterized membrane protein YedE/YeeE
MRVRAVACAFGAAFGFLISWGQFTDPDRIRDMLLLADPYLYLMMFSAIAVGWTGTRLLQRFRARALLTGAPIAAPRQRPERRHLAGAAIFGLGWSIADTCPAPVAGQLAQGVWWSLFTIGGIALGIAVFLRRQEQPATAPAPPPRSRRPLPDPVA